MELPSIFNYDIIFALFLGFFILVGAHKGLDKMIKLVIIFILPIVIIYFYGAQIIGLIGNLSMLDLIVNPIVGIVPSANQHFELIKYMILETALYVFIAVILYIVTSFIKIKEKKTLLLIKQKPWKKIVGSVLAILLFYVFAFYMIFPMQLIGLNYENSLIVKPLVENGIDIINVSPILKNQKRITTDYTSFSLMESSIKATNAREAYGLILSIQEEIFDFEERFMETILPVLRTDATAALLANKTFEDIDNPYRGIGSALVKDQGTLIFYDLLVALELESTNITTVRSEYQNARKYNGMIKFLYDELEGVVFLPYETETDENIKLVIDSYASNYEQILTSNVDFQLSLNETYDLIIGYNIFANLMVCAIEEQQNCSISTEPVNSGPKAYRNSINDLENYHNLVKEVVSKFVDRYTAGQIFSNVAIKQSLANQFAIQYESFKTYLNKYQDSIDELTYDISFANKVMYLMLEEINFKDKIENSLMLRAIINDLGSNYQKKIAVDETTFVSDETFNVTMIIVDIIFRASIWTSGNDVGAGDMERLIDKVEFYVDNNIITPKFAEELFNHFVYGKDNNYESYFIDLIEEGVVTPAAIDYFINSDSLYIKQNLKDKLSTYQ